MGLRDAALFGEMMRNNGTNMEGDRVVKKSSILDTKRNGNVTQYQLTYNKDDKDFCLFAGADYDDSKCANYTADYKMKSYLEAIGEEDEGIHGHAYRNQFWTVPDHTIMAKGIHGQHIFVNDRSKLVIVKLSSQQKLQDFSNDERMFYEIAAHFIKNEERLLCTDDPDFVFVHTNQNGVSKEKGGCEHVAKKKKNRCKKTIDGVKVRDRCPDTCDRCSR